MVRWSGQSLGCFRRISRDHKCSLERWNSRLMIYFTIL
jgi:hypothetical protein